MAQLSNRGNDAAVREYLLAAAKDFIPKLPHAENLDPSSRELNR